ncbi:MAG TPA: hypothetical protein VLF61_03825 [Rhabdochlamydiaceae bacterium]|nr:hypothetical protein [Rhabdochlamydiaceae bacterium]
MSPATPLSFNPLCQIDLKERGQYAEVLAKVQFGLKRALFPQILILRKSPTLSGVCQFA